MAADRRGRKKRQLTSEELREFEDFEDTLENVDRWRDPGVWEAALQYGAEHDGCWLSSADCRTLLDVARNGRRGKRGRGRPATTDTIFKMQQMAAYSLLLEQDMKIEAAIAATGAVYDVERATVFAARQQFVLQIQSKVPAWLEDSENRQEQRILLEAIAAWFLGSKAAVKVCQTSEHKKWGERITHVVKIMRESELPMSQKSCRLPAAQKV